MIITFVFNLKCAIFSSIIRNRGLIRPNKQRVALENGTVCVSVRAPELQFNYVSAAKLMVVK